MRTNHLKDTVKTITMPKEMQDTLLDNCLNARHSGNILFRYSKLAAAFVMAVILTAVGSTSYAAYDLYQVKNLKVFFESGITQDRIDAIGQELNGIPGIYSVRFVSADEAWKKKKKNFFSDMDEDFAASFTENPLKDSFNYDVIVELKADTNAVRDQIAALDGVRRITDLKEEKSQK